MLFVFESMELTLIDLRQWFKSRALLVNERSFQFHSVNSSYYDLPTVKRAFSCLPLYKRFNPTLEAIFVDSSADNFNSRSQYNT